MMPKIDIDVSWGRWRERKLRLRTLYLSPEQFCGFLRTVELPQPATRRRRRKGKGCKARRKFSRDRVANSVRVQDAGVVDVEELTAAEPNCSAGSQVGSGCGSGDSVPVDDTGHGSDAVATPLSSPAGSQKWQAGDAAVVESGRAAGCVSGAGLSPRAAEFRPSKFFNRPMVRARCQELFGFGSCSVMGSVLLPVVGSQVGLLFRFRLCIFCCGGCGCCLIDGGCCGCGCRGCR